MSKANVSHLGARVPTKPSVAVSIGFMWLVVLGLLAAYWPALGGSYLWDDDTHYTTNAILRDGGLLKAWLGQDQPNYWPLTWTSFWLEHQIFGFNVRVSHTFNLLLHAANALLLGAIARRLGIPLAWGVALLFAFHPANVESVAWVTQRKNLLCMVFALGATLQFAINLKKENPERNWLGVALFCASLLSKGASIGLPAVFLVVLWWKRVAFERALLLRLAPYFAVSVLFGVVEIFFMGRVRANEPAFDLALAERVDLVFRSLSFYLSKSVFPIDLQFIYPRFDFSSVSVVSFAPLIACVGAVVVLLLRKPDGWRGALASLAVFLLMVGPVLGVIDIYFFKYSYVADHYLYFALPPLAAGSASLLGRLPLKAASALLVGVSILFATMSFNQSKLYESEASLWTRTVELNPDSWMAHVHLGVVYEKRNEFDLAREHYEASLDLGPSETDEPRIHYNLANIHFRKSQFREAIAEYQIALESLPNLTPAWGNMAGAYAYLGEMELHDQTLTRALDSAADESRIHLNFAVSLHARGQIDEASKHMAKARALNPRIPNPGW